MRKYLGIAIFTLVGLLLGMLIMLYVNNKIKKIEPKEVVVQDSSVVLEQIRKVYKLVVVEGQFAEILSHKEYYGWDLPGFRKQALVKVEAMVSVGYNLDSLRMDIDHDNKIITLQNWPEPEITSIDTDISYYDIENSMFNSFSPEELTSLNKAAKDSIRAKAERSRLMTVARQQASDMFDMITFLAVDNGWKVRYVDDFNIINEMQGDSLNAPFGIENRVGTDKVVPVLSGQQDATESGGN